jgi:serine/threonine-protein phosphatase 2A regulatory subunit B'
MVYNAMKLFMEINPQLFDDCSHDYTQRQSTAEQRQQIRQSKWDRLEQQAQSRRNSQPTVPSSITPRGPKVNPPPRIDEVDPITQDSQKRLDALRLQDEGGTVRDQRRPWEGERSNHVSSFILCPCTIIFLPVRWWEFAAFSFTHQTLYATTSWLMRATGSPGV